MTWVRVTRESRSIISLDGTIVKVRVGKEWSPSTEKLKISLECIDDSMRESFVLNLIEIVRRYFSLREYFYSIFTRPRQIRFVCLERTFSSFFSEL